MKLGNPPARIASVLILAFVLGTAIYTANPGLYVLAGLCAAATALAWRRRR